MSHTLRESCGWRAHFAIISITVLTASIKNVVRTRAACLIFLKFIHLTRPWRLHLEATPMIQIKWRKTVSTTEILLTEPCKRCNQYAPNVAKTGDWLGFWWFLVHTCSQTFELFEILIHRSHIFWPKCAKWMKLSELYQLHNLLWASCEHWSGQQTFWKFS